jgi:hypothetical protein
VTGLVLRDAKGKPIVRSDYDEEHHTIAAICGFRPRVSSTYYVDVEGEVDNGAEYDFEGSYAVSLRAR